MVVMALTLFYYLSIPRLCKKQAGHALEDFFPPFLLELFTLGHPFKSCFSLVEFSSKPFESRVDRGVKSSSRSLFPPIPLFKQYSCSTLSRMGPLETNYYYHGETYDGPIFELILGPAFPPKLTYSHGGNCSTSLPPLNSCDCSISPPLLSLFQFVVPTNIVLNQANPLTTDLPRQLCGCWYKDLPLRSVDYEPTTTENLFPLSPSTIQTDSLIVSLSLRLTIRQILPKVPPLSFNLPLR
jgi:hypothetical protein